MGDMIKVRLNKTARNTHIPGKANQHFCVIPDFKEHTDVRVTAIKRTNMSREFPPLAYARLQKNSCNEKLQSKKLCKNVIHF